MPKKLTTEEFIERANKVHNRKYDYSKAVYVNDSTNVYIICPEHGCFLQKPANHIWLKHGCPICAINRRKSAVESVGLNDLVCTIGVKDKIAKKCWRTWRAMLNRCYDAKYHKTRHSYVSCSVCEEWHKLSSFKKWFDEHYVEGWALDKDILVKGNKVYSPATCCFVPQRINTAFIKREALRGNLPIGVTTNGNKYIAQLSKYGRMIRSKTLGTIQEAFLEYKNMKENYLKELADKYKDQLDPRVYEALYNYKVEITD